MSNNNPNTLDDRLRARATHELTEEVAQAFDKIRRYFGGTNERNRLVITSYGSVTVRKSPNDPDHNHYVIDMVDLLHLLKEKAIENENVARGDKAVADFMNRVEALGQEIDDLRSEVHSRE